MSSVDRKAVEKMINDVGVDIDDEPYTAPPGEEGFDISHEGGEYEAFEALPTPAPALLNSPRGGAPPAPRKTAVWTAMTPPPGAMTPPLA
ncbi:uncharacterized protein F5147DRAFT_776965 [Suillus discolor]|uniref:Uncharacterized protein n=1 Tax=Suillus discolor TaxID=1912936 RepID=A0A9P7F1W4_9AGAM|nr:uncharacterized protein F5147DRAFT_776965 [Suillus discolor]KAG2100404.1 hypothetical protein F5147DRAFT_776965 [Suillus discolor]